MKIREILSIGSIELNGSASDKQGVVEKMADLMQSRGNIKDRELFLKDLIKREKESATGIGRGIAIPHCKSRAVSETGLAVMRLKDGVDFSSFDRKPVDLVFMIAAPENEDNEHLNVLKHLAEILMDPKVVSALRSAKTPEAFLAVMDEAESMKAEKESVKRPRRENDLILAVTACPTGIAHTYMAAEAIGKAARKSGIPIQIETRGSGGAKNTLTDEDIRDAKAVIVAADVKVPMDRFEGKRVLIVKVSDAINKSDVLLKRVQSGDIPVYHAKPVEPDEASLTHKETGYGAYKHLMNGVSHMLPFVIGAGIIGALAYMIDTLAGYGATAGIDFGSATPLAAFFKYISDLAMGLMVPVLAGYIACSIADRPGLSVGFIGGLLAAKGNALASLYEWHNLGTVGRLIERFAFSADGVNTVSGFLGGIVIGFLAGYIVRWLENITEGMPSSMSGIRPALIYPVFGLFIVGVLMCFIFNPIIGFINNVLTSLLIIIFETGLIWFLGLILGAMMAVDMGGAINKAAYLFGLSLLSTANGAAADASPVAKAAYIAMASIMVGGMVPPLGIALACRIFPQKFSKGERSSWISNITIASSFITEGAIPFAASDPVHVIPATVIGAGVAGLLSAVFKCTLMAPHGGVFVFATVGHPILYIAALLTGSVVTMLLLGLLKKDHDS